MSEITEAAGARTLTIKIGLDHLSSLAWRAMTDLMEDELCKSQLEVGAVAEAEFYVAIKKAIAHKCTRVVIEIEAESILARGPVAGADA
jgi:hypothetical protein